MQCDETKPTCQNCAKTNQQCPGARDDVDLIFRPENPSCKRKGRKKARHRNAQPAARPERSASKPCQYIQVPLSLDSPRPPKREEKQIRIFKQGQDIATDESHGALVDYKRCVSAERVATTLLSTTNDVFIQQRLCPGLEQEATTFFFVNFVLNARGKETSRGFLEVVIPMFETCCHGSALHLATRAVSVATIAQWPRHRHLAARSSQLYMSAVAAVQRDLQSPRSVSDNATLLTVLMLSLYESITSSQHSAQAYSKHVDGAVAIVRARGICQLNDKESVLLFRAVRIQMLQNAVQQRKAIPKFPGPRGWLSDMEADESVAGKLLQYSIRMPDVLSRAKRVLARAQTPETISEVVGLMHEAHAIQTSFAKWETRLPPAWEYRSVANVPSTLSLDCVENIQTWPGVLHIYQDVHVACVRNNNRIGQILCASTFLDAMKWLDPIDFGKHEAYAKMKGTLQALVDDVCYGVPFHLYGAKGVEKLQALAQVRQEMQSPAGRGVQPRAVSEALGGYFLIWPLYVASNIQDVPDIQRRWMRGRLAAIARHYGLNEHTNIMNALNKGRSGAYWYQKLNDG